MKPLVRAGLVAAFALNLSGCLAVAAGSAVVKTTGAVAGAGVKATGALVGAAIPDGDRKD